MSSCFPMCKGELYIKLQTYVQLRSHQFHIVNIYLKIKVYSKIIVPVITNKTCTTVVFRSNRIGTHKFAQLCVCRAV